MKATKQDKTFSGEKNYVAKAFKRCENEGLLPEYFSELEKEEQTMIFGEYSYEDDIRVQRNEAYNDGMEKGIAQGVAQQKAEEKSNLLKKTRKLPGKQRKLNGFLLKMQDFVQNKGSPHAMKNFSLLDEYLDKPNNCRIRYFRHEPTGMKIIHCLNSTATENSFKFCFKTFSHNSTGIAHAVEHMVLLGSKKYPYKNVFNLMGKNSFCSVMNAQTSIADTTYFATSFLKSDYYRILDYYGDAVFFPLFRQEDFYNEVWHPETDENGNGFVTGVVYNEIKDHKRSEISDYLFSGSFEKEYSVGDILELTKLKREDLVEFHKKFYVPANCLLLLYGNIPADEQLEFLEKNLLSALPSGTEPVEYPESYMKFHGEEKVIPIAASANDDPKYKMLSMFFNIKDENLDGWPLQKLERDAVKNCILNKTQKFISKKYPKLSCDVDELGYRSGNFIHLDILGALSESGLKKLRHKLFKFLKNEKYDDDSVSDFIIKFRESRRYEFFSSAEDFFYSMLAGWLNFDAPFMDFAFPGVEAKFLERLKKEGKKYVRDILNRLILNNENRVTLFLTSDLEGNERRKKSVEQSTSRIISEMKDSIPEIMSVLKKHRQQDFEEEEKIKELFPFNFDEIPFDTLKDTCEVKKIESKNGTFEILETPEHTKDLCFGKILFTFENVLPEELPYMDILGPFFTRKLYDFKLMSSFELDFAAIYLNNGTIYTKNSVPAKEPLDLFTGRNCWSIDFDAGKNLEFKDCMNVISDAIKNLDFKDRKNKKLIKQFLKETRAKSSKPSLESDFGSGEAYYQVMSYLLPAVCVDASLNGFASGKYYYDMLCENDNVIIEKVSNVWQKIKNSGVAFAIFGEQNFLDEAEGILKDFAENAGLKPLVQRKPLDEKAFLEYFRDSGIDSSDSMYCAFVQDTDKYSNLALPLLDASDKENFYEFLFSFWLTDVLMQKIRREKNAYSVDANMINSIFVLSSQQDANPAKTVEIFEQCIEESSRHEFTKDELENAIKKYLAIEFMTRTPQEKGICQINTFIGNYRHTSIDDIKRFLREITPEDLHKAAVKVAANLNKKRVCIITDKKPDEKYKILNQ